MLMCIDGGEARIQAHELDIQWMNEYLHRTAILTLLKVSILFNKIQQSFLLNVDCN
jgi:hypothetical protein